MIAYITELNTETYQNFTTSAPLFFVDIWATWCCPCKVIAPIIEEISNEYYGKVSIGKIDSDANRDFVMEMGVRSIPTLILYKKGVEVERTKGTLTKGDITQMLDKHLDLQDCKPYRCIYLCH